MALYNKEQIMEIIPHRDPFLLIDEVEELEVGKRVVAIESGRIISDAAGGYYGNGR